MHSNSHSRIQILCCVRLPEGTITKVILQSKFCSKTMFTVPRKGLDDAGSRPVEGAASIFYVTPREFLTIYLDWCT
jgi:hypothetical protein